MYSKWLDGTAQIWHCGIQSDEQPTVTYLPYCVSGSTLMAVGHSRLLARWPGTHARILSGIQRAAQTVLGVYLKRTCLRITSASSALGILSDYALYKSTHSLTQGSTGPSFGFCSPNWICCCLFVSRVWSRWMNTCQRLCRALPVATHGRSPAACGPAWCRRRTRTSTTRCRRAARRSTVACLWRRRGLRWMHVPRHFAYSKTQQPPRFLHLSWSLCRLECSTEWVQNNLL